MGLLLLLLLLSDSSRWGSCSCSCMRRRIKKLDEIAARHGSHTTPHGWLTISFIQAIQLWGNN
jgi:hypothetical protein